MAWLRAQVSGSDPQISLGPSSDTGQAAPSLPADWRGPTTAPGPRPAAIQCVQVRFARSPGCLHVQMQEGEGEPRWQEGRQTPESSHWAR